MSKRRTVATVAATTGPPFRIERNGNTYLLKRPLDNGRPQTIVIAHADVINLSNALIDAIEEQDN